MTEKHLLKLPTDFSDPKEWRAYVRATVPPEDVDFTLAYGRTALLLRFYEVRGERFPDEFRTELTRIDGLSDPARTEFLVALNDRILAAMTQFLVTPPASSAFDEAGTPRELIGNLLDNAGKWARQRIVVRVERDPDLDAVGRRFFIVAIDDDGPGLDPQARAAALVRGQKLDESRPGSGLGLSIVVDLASAYGGGLRLEESPLGGLRASLRLPSL